MSHFEAALAYLLPREREIEEQASDPGGITNRGISLRLLKSFEAQQLRTYGLAYPITAEDVRALNLNQVAAIYKGEFWDVAPFGEINNQNVCNYLFDACVNMGIAPGVKCLQRAIWAVARNRSIVVDDGILGPETLEAVNGCSSTILIAAMRSERGGLYRLIANVNTEEGKENLEGWLNRSYNQST